MGTGEAVQQLLLIVIPLVILALINGLPAREKS